jgi:uncharacterized RDD family membrane protein YckC
MTEPRTDHRDDFSNSQGDDELVTGEAVALDVRPAGVILRAAGTIIDWATYLLLYLLLALTIGLVAGSYLDTALSQALMIIGLVVSVLIVPITVEVATGGRSLGRLAIGARIVRDDGGAIQLRHAFIRALVGLLEIYMTFGGLAVTVGLLNNRSKRLGDLLAGTYSQNERVSKHLPAVHGVPLELTQWAATVDIVRLPDALSRRIAQFLSQSAKLSSVSRARIAQDLVDEVSHFVSPLPQAPAEPFLQAVTAVRRDREYAALLLERDRLDRLTPVLDGLPHGFPAR